jgi:murein DD-endopeptidase MepM/ murein hydrolase activator NlpD
LSVDGDTRPEPVVPEPPQRPHRFIYGLLVVSITLNVVLLMRSVGDAPVEATPESATQTAAAQTADPEDAPPAAPQEAGSRAAALPNPTAAEPAAAAPAASPTSTAPDAPAEGGWQLAEGAINHSIARTFHDAVGDDDGPALAAEVTRLFVWDMDMTRDLQKGDRVSALWRRHGDEYEVFAATLHSQKLGRTLRAYRYTRPGDRWPSYWSADGTEVPHRLIDGPLDTYEQVTSLLKDRPTHKGMDFKAPVGTPIRTPRGGEVLQTDWNWKHNGNSVAIRWDDGHVAKFLHLSETRVKPGQRVARGHIIGLTGNTGRSTAPHLHYQIERGRKVIDPLDYHRTAQRRLPADALPGFRAEVERADGMLAADAL